MLLRNRIFSLAFLGFLVFSPLTEVIKDYNDEYEYSYHNINDVEVEEVKVIGLFDATLTCLDITNKLSDIVPDPNRCAPRSVTWTAGFGFPGADTGGQIIDIQFFWNWPSTAAAFKEIVPATWNGSRYVATANFTYPKNEVTCTYVLRARLRFDGNECGNSDGNITEGIVVWDDLANANLGTHDVDHDNSSAGVEVGETVEVCRGDDSAVRLQDASTFNCLAPIEPTPANENRRSRWVQWVYGTFSDVTTGAAADEKIIINGVSYTNADLPIYGNPTQQVFPPDVLAPNAITDDIQMPTSALIGERFEVTIRSFNICNPYSVSNDLNPPQGGANDVFQINGAGTEQPDLTLVTGGVAFYANDNPITRTFDIVIAPQPPDPVAVPKDVCNGSALPNFQINAAGNQAVEWFEDNAGAPGNLIANSLGANSLQLPAADFEPGGAINNTTAGVYEVWARYSSNTGSQNCWSEPVMTSLDVREDLPTPTTVTSTEGVSGFTVCADNGNITFTVTDGPPGSGTPGGPWEYDWSFGGGALNDNLAWVTGDGGQSRTMSITSTAASGARQVRVRRLYTNTDDNGSTCASNRRNFDFTLNPVSIGGTLTGTNTICLGDNTGNISLSGNTGAIQGWEVNVNAGGFVVDGSLGTANPIDPIPAVIGTHEYRAIIQSGVCAATNSSTVTVTVNPVPPKPTITPSGPTTLCEDASVTLSSSTINADSYQWYEGGVPLGGETNQTINLSTVAESGSYTVEVIGIGPTSCTSPPSDPTVVTINPLPTATVMGGGSVCAGNPAPDIVWTFTGTAPYDFTITLTPGAPIVVNNHPTNTYTIAAPNPGVDTDYEITALQDANTCNGTALGGIASVAIIVTLPPSIDTFTPGPDVCHDNGSAIAPVLTLDLNPNSVQTYDITYNIYDSTPTFLGTQTVNQTTDAAGVTTIALDYAADLGSNPDTYQIEITSIINTGTLCNASGLPADQFITINPDPIDPVNPVNNISCVTGGGVPLSVDIPPVGTQIRWYQDVGLTTDAFPAFGAVSGTRQNIFTPIASTTATFYAVVESTTGPTFCQSLNSLAVTQTEDQQPSLANAEQSTAIGVPPVIVGTCDDTFTFDAVAADNSGTGTWTASNGAITFDNDNDPATTARNIPLGTHTFTWTVTPALGVCATSFDEYDVTRHVLPAANDFTADFCEIQPQSSDSYDVTAADLTSFDDSVTGILGSIDRTVNYFTDPGLTTAVVTPYTVADNNQIYAQVIRTDVVPNCESSSTVTFNIITLPDAIDQDDVNNAAETVFCEDVVGGGSTTGIDLTVLDNDIVNNLANRTVDWYIDPGYLTLVPNSSNATATNGTIFYALVTETASGSSCIDFAQATITVNSRPANNDIIGATNQCVGGSTSLYQVNPGPVGTTYLWNVPGDFTVFGGGTVNDFFVLLQFPIATTATLEVTEVSPESCAGDLEQLIIDVQASPAVPVIAGPAAVCENEAGVVYSVAAAPATTYAWTVPAGASIIAGQGSNSITVNFGVTGGNIEVTPTSSGGCSSTVPATQGVTINLRPILDPALSAAVCSKDDINITLAAAVVSPVAAATYDVTASVAPGLIANLGPTTGNGLAAAAIINDNYTNTTGGPLTVTYSVTPVSADNCAGTSVNVIATIDPEPVMASGLDVTVCSDDPSGLNFSTAAGSVAAASYNLLNVNIPGALTPGGSNATFPQNGVAANFVSLDTYTNEGNISLVVEYTVIPVSADLCEGDQLIINVTIDPEPVIDPNLDAIICSDLPIGVILNTNGVSVAADSYFIADVSIPGGVTAGGSNASFPALSASNAYIANDVYTNVTTLPVNVIYEVQGRTAGACVGDSEFITVTINPEPVVNPAITNTVCSDDVAGITMASLGTAAAAADYNYVDVTIPAGLTPAVTNAVIPANNEVDTYVSNDSYTNLTNAQLTVIYEVQGVSANGCDSDSEFISVNIDPEPVIDPALAATVCSDEPIAINFATAATSVAALSYDYLSVNIDPGLTPDVGNVILANTVMAGYVAADQYTNTTNGALTVTYEVRGTAGGTGCVGESEFIVVTINPEPVMSPSLNTIVCSDDAVGVVFANNGISIAAANYNLVNVTIPPGLTAGGTNVAFPANTVAQGYIASDSYTNQTTNSINVTYEVQGVSGAGCVGDTESIQITINPEPVISNTLDATVCSDAATGLNLNTLGSSVAAANYNIVDVTIPAGLTAGANAGVPANGVAAGYLAGDTYTNQTNSALIVVYEVRGVSATPCVGDSEFISITIDPEPVIDNTLNTAVCSNLPIGLVLNTDATSVPAQNYDIVSVNAAPGLVAGGLNAIVPASAVGVNYLSTDTYQNPTNAPLAVTYTVFGTSAKSCAGDPLLITITIDPEPIISPTLDKTLCSDDAINITLVTNGTSAAAVDYNVKSISLPAGLTAAAGNAIIPGNNVLDSYIFSDSYTNQTANPLVVTYEVTGTSAGGCEGVSEFIDVTVNPEPVVNPGLNTTVCSDAAVGVTLGTNGTSVVAANYNIVDVVADAGLIPGGTNVGFPINGVAANYFTNDTYTNQTTGALNVIYEVRGVSGAGCIGDSEFVTIAINPEPVVSTTLDATVCSDDVIGVNLATDPASVGAANYNLINVAITAGLAPAGTNAPFPANGIALDYIANDAFTNTTASPLTVTYSVAGVSVNNCVGEVRLVVLTIDPEPVVDPALDAVVCSDLPIGLTFNTNGSSVAAADYNLLDIQVAVGLTPGVGNVVAANGISANYVSNDSYTNTTNAPLNVTYEVLGVSADNCLGDPEIITITINPEPIMNAGLDKTVCSDETIALNLNDNGLGVPATSFNIVAVTIPAGLTAAGGNAAFPANNQAGNYLANDEYNNVTALPIDVTYEVRGVSAAGCIGDSEFILVTVNPEPVISTTLDVTICSDDITGVVLNTNGTSVAAANYNIISVNVPVGLTPGATNSIVPANAVPAGYITNDTYTNQTSGVIVVSYVVEGTSADNCLGDQLTITVTVNPEPVVNAGLDDNVCSDAVTGLVLNTDGVSIGASNYNIIDVVIDPNLTAAGSNAVFPATGEAAAYLANDVFTNATNGPLDVVYEVRGVSFSACEGDSRFITITIEPGPIVSPNLDVTLCSDQPVGVTLATDAGSVAATAYNVLSITPNPSLIVGGGNVPAANNVATNYIFNDTYSNTTSIPLTVTYEVKGVSGATCIGPSEFIIVTIDPEPVMDPGLDKTVCSDEMVGLILNTNGVSVGATTYNVVSVSVPVGITADAGNAAIPAAGVVDGYLSGDKFTNQTNGPLTVTYEARGESASTCEGQSRFINITIDPEPVIDPNLDATVCSDEAVGVNLTTNGASVAAVNYNILTVTPAVGLVASGSNAAIPANAVVAGYFSNDSYTNTTSGPLNVIYEVQGVSTDNCIGDSEFITVTIDPQPVIDAAITNTVCSDNIIAINLGVAGTSVNAANYDVLAVTIPAGLTAGANAAIPGNNIGIGYLSNDTYTNQTAAPIDVIYEVRGNSLAGCTGDSEFISVRINAEPVLNPALDATVCSDETTGIIFSTNGTSVTASTYNLISVTPQAGLVADPGNAIPALGQIDSYIQNDRFTNTSNIALNVQYVVEPVSALSCIGDQQTIVLTVNPEPVLDPTLSPAPVCSDVPTGVILDVDPSSVAAVSYNILNITWAPGLIPGGGNSSIGNGQAANAIAADVYTNTSNGALIATYDIVPISADNCEGDLQQLVFTVNPAPALSTALDQTVCSNQNTGITLATNGVSTPAQNYEVQSVAAVGLTPGVGNTALPITTNNTLVINGDTYDNPTNAILTAVYTVVPISAAGCRGPAETITVTVEPTVTAVANNTTPTICSNSATSITLSSPTLPSAGNIVFNISAVGSSASVSGYVPLLNFLPQGYEIADFLVNTGNTAETVTYTITPIASGGAGGSGCTGTPIVEIVNIDPLPIITPGQFTTVCSNEPTNHTITTVNNLVGTTYTWPAPALSDPGLTGGAARAVATDLPIQDTFINTTAVRQSATYDITPIGPSGCVGAVTQITIFIDPTPDGTIAVDNPVVCMNGSALLSFTITVGVAPFEIVYSDGTTDFTVSNIANSHFIAQNNLMATTTYTLKSIQDVNGCLANIVGQEVTVEVENPIADFTADIVEDCTPLVVTFTNNDIQAGTQYEWNWGDGSPVEITSNPTVEHTFINNSTVSDISYNVLLTATRTNGAVVCTSIDTEFVTIKAGVNLSVNPTTTDGCSPLQVSFLNTSQGVLDHTWFWREQGTMDQNDLTNISSATFIITNPSTTTKIYEVVYQGDRFGCGDELITEVTVGPDLDADFTVTPGTTVSINDPTITVTNNTTNKNSWDHLWEWGDGTSTTAVDPGSHTYATFGNFDLILTITDPVSNCQDVMPQIITVEPVFPVVDFEVDITEGCRPLTVTFTNLSTSVDPDTYLWEFTDERGTPLGTSNLENPSFTFYNASRINVTLSGSNPLGITDTETKLNYIEIFEIPTASFTVTPETVYLPDQLLFTSNLSALADAFEWDFNGDGDVDSEEFEPQFQYEDAGVFNISLIATNTATTCSDTLMVEKAVKVIEGGAADIPNGFFPGSGSGSGGNSGGPGGSGAPNSVFLPRIKGLSDDGFLMQIFDRWGHLLFESTDKTVGWNGRDAGGKLYPVGVYVYQLELRYDSGQQATIVGDVTLIR